MITKINDTDLRTLSLFTKGYDKDYYIRETEKLLNVSSRTSLVTLAKLENKGILKSKTRGKIKTYMIRKSLISREFFILTEQYRKIKFLAENHLIKEVLEKADEFMDGIVVIFGSYAKGTQKNDSDLDLFVVGKFDEKQIKEVGEKYGIGVNIMDYPMKIFEKEINEDILLKEISENHILIKDAEGFVRRVLQWTR